MNIKQLEAFLLVAEMGSFTKAARKLFLSQPAVSFLIKSLEEEMEVELFSRQERRVELSTAGRLLLPEARQLLKQYQRMHCLLEELKGLKTGLLELGASTIPGEYLLPWYIGYFRQKYPGVKVTLRVSGSGDVMDWLKERLIDIGIAGRPAPSADIISEPWLADSLVLLVPPGHEWADGQRVRVRDLVGQPFILREPGSGTRQVWEERLATAGLSVADLSVVMEMGSTRAVISAVQAGLGIGVVSYWAAAECLALRLVKHVQVAEMDLSRYLYLLRGNHDAGNYAAQVFWDFLKKEKPADILPAERIDTLAKYYDWAGACLPPGEADPGAPMPRPGAR
ncbi:MAG: selenium metabolism-associated LysR family transcriptional regulator [Bacillota bacterium]|uniref:selenium metabolism-associated LysR family transcriptional regulator n=1 Tax=Desulfurispora thermophila TaxID=265470 RepID=UPI00036DFF2E|nr:selenium metabolism-associated LysR family transcriptional regulator [Desulfurispora thermophila]